MNTLKKLFITLTVLVISMGLSHAVYATELDRLENTNTSEVAADIESTDNEGNIPDETSDTIDLEGEFDPESYEIYIDEQGQVYYIEKEPAEIEIVEIDEIVDEDEIADDEEIIADDGIIADNKTAAGNEMAAGKEEVSSNVAAKSDKKEKNNEATVKNDKTAEKEAQKTVQKEKAKKPSYSAEDLRLLACLVYSEAGNQPYKGMLAVANVVLNRVKSDAYSHVNTIKEVIYDKKWAVQFSVTIKSKKTGKSLLDKALEVYDTGKFTGSNPEAERNAMNKAIKAAKAALNGENNIGNYLCFRMNNSGAKKIKKQYSDYTIIGNHIFYRTK